MLEDITGCALVAGMAYMAASIMFPGRRIVAIALASTAAIFMGAVFLHDCERWPWGGYPYSKITDFCSSTEHPKPS